MTSTTDGLDGVEQAKQRARRSVRDAKRQAGAQALRDAAREIRTAEVDETYDTQHDWANWLELRAMEVETGVIKIGPDGDTGD